MRTFLDSRAWLWVLTPSFFKSRLDRDSPIFLFEITFLESNIFKSFFYLSVKMLGNTMSLDLYFLKVTLKDRKVYILLTQGRKIPLDRTELDPIPQGSGGVSLCGTNPQQ